MRIVARYDHKGGAAFLMANHAAELREVESALSRVDAIVARTKVSREKTMRERVLYSLVVLNAAIKTLLYPQGWATLQGNGKFTEPHVILSTTVAELKTTHVGFRAMDGVKNRVGLEIQFGKYAFMGYDILSKMPIFARRGVIDCGIEIVPMKSLAIGVRRAMRGKGNQDEDAETTSNSRMSTGVSYFEQIKADLEARGVADLDIPVLILGIDV